jgi:hypothetical protein
LQYLSINMSMVIVCRAAQAVGVLTIIGLAIYSFSNILAFYWVVLVLALQRGPILPCQVGPAAAAAEAAAAEAAAAVLMLVAVLATAAGAAVMVMFRGSCSSILLAASIGQLMRQPAVEDAHYKDCLH